MRLVQAQRDVGVLGRVFGRARQLDLVEADLAGALAAHVGEGNGGVAQVAQRHGCPCRAACAIRTRTTASSVSCTMPRKRHAVVGEDVAVVLQVLARPSAWPGLPATASFFPAPARAAAAPARRRSGAPPGCRRPCPLRPTAKCRPAAPSSDRARWFRCRPTSAARCRSSASQRVELLLGDDGFVLAA